MVVCMMIIAIYHYSINENVQGQEQQPTNNTDNYDVRMHNPCIYYVGMITILKRES